MGHERLALVGTWARVAPRGGPHRPAPHRHLVQQVLHGAPLLVLELLLRFLESRKVAALVAAATHTASATPPSRGTPLPQEHGAHGYEREREGRGKGGSVCCGRGWGMCTDGTS